MYRIYMSKGSLRRPRQFITDLTAASYHRPSPTISTFGDEIVSTKRKTINDYTFTYQFDEHVWAYINYNLEVPVLQLYEDGLIYTAEFINELTALMCEEEINL